MKKLPKLDHEEHEPTYVKPKICSRRYHVKVMYLGVVACPNPEHDFDSRVFLKRVSNRVPAQRTSQNKKFSVDIDVNEEIKTEGWIECVSDNMKVAEALENIYINYDLDEFVFEQLEL